MIPHGQSMTHLLTPLGLLFTSNKQKDVKYPINISTSLPKDPFKIDNTLFDIFGHLISFVYSDQQQKNTQTNVLDQPRNSTGHWFQRRRLISKIYG